MNLIKAGKKLGNAALDLIYPSSIYCLCCGNIIDSTRNYSLCDHCISHMGWEKCGEKDVSGMRTIWCLPYGTYERSLIFSLKYNGHKYVARTIGEIMADRVKLSDLQFDLIVPVPISKERLNERGFNQVELIGKYMGKALNKPCIGSALIRTRNTLAMRGLGPAERAANIQGAIALNEKYVKIIQGKRILLIDDFFTTGSTALQCKKILMEGKPAQVEFLAFTARV